MKKVISLFYALFLMAGIAFAQTIHTTEIKDKYLKSILGFVDTVIFKKNEDIFLTLYRVNNPSGSANLSESDEVSNRFLVLVSAFDEYPEQHLFNLGNFILPKILKFEKPARDKFRLLIEYGIYKQRKRSFINISLNKVTVTAK